MSSPFAFVFAFNNVEVAYIRFASLQKKSRKSAARIFKMDQYHSLIIILRGSLVVDSKKMV